MKIATITKIEKQTDTDFFVVSFAIAPPDLFANFDLLQLGGVDGDDYERPSINRSGLSIHRDGSAFCMVQSGLKLQVGDAITDEQGGNPIIAPVHGQTVLVDMQIVKQHDYRDVFQAKFEGRI